MQPLKKTKKNTTQPLQICIGPTIRIGRESWCLPYAGFFSLCIQISRFCTKSEIFCAVTQP